MRLIGDGGEDFETASLATDETLSSIAFVFATILPGEKKTASNSGGFTAGSSFLTIKTPL